MNNERKGKKRIPILLAAILLSLAACCFITGSRAVYADETVQETTEQEQEEKLVITVVEDIPVEDIDDSAVPLAAPGAKEAGAFWDVFPFVIIAVVILGVIVIFRVRYIKRKHQIRQLIDGFDEDSGSFQV